VIRVSPARQQSNLRVAYLRGELAAAIGRLLDDDPDLTHEEVLAALLGVADGHVQHLRAGTREETPEHE
jgi:hypothetical protein